MGIYFPIKLQNVATLEDCNLILLLQALEILITVPGHYYSLSNKRLKKIKSSLKISQANLTRVAARIIIMPHTSFCHPVTRMGASVFLGVNLFGKKRGIAGFGC